MESRSLRDYSTEDLRAELARRDAERAAAIRAAGELSILDVKHHRATFGTGLREAHEAVKAGYRAPKGWAP